MLNLMAVLISPTSFPSLFWPLKGLHASADLGQPAEYEKPNNWTSAKTGLARFVMIATLIDLRPLPEAAETTTAATTATMTLSSLWPAALRGQHSPLRIIDTPLRILFIMIAHLCCCYRIRIRNWNWPLPPTRVHLFVRAVSLLSLVGSPKSVVVMDIGWPLLVTISPDCWLPLLPSVYFWIALGLWVNSWLSCNL